jgi:hypothetical protein
MIGLSQGVYDYALAYMFQRKAFNKLIGEFQVSFYRFDFLTFLFITNILFLKGMQHQYAQGNIQYFKLPCVQHNLKNYFYYKLQLQLK